MEQQQHEQPPRDPLSVLRGMESTPPGDLEWAKHCTRQQAIVLGLILPHGQAATLAELSQAVGVPIDLVDELPVSGTAFPTEQGWRIHISAQLGETDQVRTALHELKHVIDHPVRGPGLCGDFSNAEYEHLADYFAALVLGTDNNDTGRRTSP